DVAVVRPDRLHDRDVSIGSDHAVVVVGIPLGDRTHGRSLIDGVTVSSGAGGPVRGIAGQILRSGYTVDRRLHEGHVVGAVRPGTARRCVLIRVHAPVRGGVV